MADNVIPLDPTKAGNFNTANEPDEMAAAIKRHNEENLVSHIKAVENDEVRSLIMISLNYDGSVNWSVSGQCSSFEIIAALERTKIDFMDSE